MNARKNWALKVENTLLTLVIFSIKRLKFQMLTLGRIEVSESKNSQ